MDYKETQAKPKQNQASEPGFWDFQTESFSKIIFLSTKNQKNKNRLG